MNLLLTHPQVETDQRFVIHGVDWETYEKFLAAVGDRHIFLTYDGKSLELMVPSPTHEFIKIGLAQLVRIAAAELGLRVKGLASTTLRRKDRQRGLEADECFYIQNVSTILGKRNFDFTKDPPPDLAIEIDITSSSLDRQGIYAQLGVPEIWRYDGATLRFYRLITQGAYEDCKHSPTFPFIDPIPIVEILKQTYDLDDFDLERLLRAWVRKHLPTKGKKSFGKGMKKPKQ